MNFLELARTRYTTKKYNPNGKISHEQIQQLKEIIRLTPSSINSQPWKVYFVSEEKTKKDLASVSFFNEPKILNSSHLLVFSCINNVEKFEAHIRQHLPEGSVAYFDKFLKPLSELEIISWLKQQVYLALGFFLAACASMEIDSTPMEGINNKEYDRILQSEGYTVLFAVTIGYRDVTDANQPSMKQKYRLPLDEIVQTI